MIGQYAELEFRQDLGVIVPKRPKKPEWDPPVSISIEKNGVIHNGHYELVVKIKRKSLPGSE